MGKSKKRNRTKALYEAAAAAKRRLQAKQEVVDVDVDVDDGATIDELELNSSKKMPQDQGAQKKSSNEMAIRSTQMEPTKSDIATTLFTIRHLVKSPDLFLHSKDYKELRGALHPLITERLKSYDKGIDYRQKVTMHLSHKRWSAALSSLSAAKDFQQIPKQGTIQRWVRDVDLCEDGPVKIQLLTSILSCKTNTNNINTSDTNTNNDSDSNSNSNKNSNYNNNNNSSRCDGTSTSAKHDGENDHENDTTNTINEGTSNKHDPALALIEAQKRYNNMKSGNHSNHNREGVIGEGADTINNSTELQVLEGWKIPSSSSSCSSPSSQNRDSNNRNNNDDDGGFKVEDLLSLESRIVYQETASERTPPNRYDLLLHATEPFAVLPLNKDERKTSSTSSSLEGSGTVVFRHEVPFLTNSFCLENVLSPYECSKLTKAASILGYRPDHPSNLPSPTGIDSCEWLVDDSIHDLVYDRVKQHLPLSVGEAASSSKTEGNNKSNNTNALCGINKRWRFFRYGQDCVYRPHIDGSWPAGSLSEDGKSYEVDTSGSTRSYLTFLIYLNDGFEGGETKFYYPDNNTNNNNNNHNEAGRSSSTSTSLVVKGIIPQRGSVLVFPQGNTASLLHEGSAVTKGTKYVIRTDVLYKHA